MRRLTLITLLFILPTAAQAACSTSGFTVVFVNGVFDTQTEAEKDRFALQQKLSDNLNGESVSVKLGYNATHLAGLGDLIETNFPALNQFDLDTILMQMHADVTTRKVLLVGHSQGAVYANKIYEYLTTHGVPKEDVAVYAVATPETYVAGGGNYITYTLDDVISVYARVLGRLKPLAPNVDFVDFLNSPDKGPVAQGHSFIDMYLGSFGTRMLTDMQNEMAALKTTAGTAADGCFDPPENSLAHKATSVALAVGDPTSAVIKNAGIGVYQGAAAVGKVTTAAVGAAGDIAGFLGSAFGFGSTPQTTASSGVGGLSLAGFGLLKAIAGSSLNLKDLQELNGKNQGGAVALALQPNNNSGKVLGDETQKLQPFEPLVPPPPGIGGGGSPGFGGGAPAVKPTAEDTVAATTTASSTPATTPTPATPTSITLYDQLDTSTLGETAPGHGGGTLPIQRLGTGLSGSVGSVAYKVNGSNLTSPSTGIPSGYGEVQLFACNSGTYTACGAAKAGSNFSPQIESQTGNDAVVLVDMSSFHYSFNPSLYYYLKWITAGDLAIYGSASDTYTNGDAAWFDNGFNFTPDAHTTDVGFRLCSTATCDVSPDFPLAVGSVTLDGSALSYLYPSINNVPVATTTSVGKMKVVFNKDLTTQPTIIDSALVPSFADAVAATVGDCGDSDAKTFCFTFVPAAGIDDQYHYFRISDAQDALGQLLATTTYKFIVDTRGPTITPTTLAVKNVLPTLVGQSDDANWPIQILLNNIFYTVPVSGGAWSLGLGAGEELAEGVYPVVASSTDANGNPGPVANWTLAVDLTPPIITFNSPAEGEATSSPTVIFNFSVSDTSAIKTTCQVDSGGTSECSSGAIATLDPGAHTFTVFAFDAAGNTTTLVRNFTVLP